MSLVILAVGKVRSHFREACDEYLRRIARYGRIEEREVREAGRAPTPALAAKQESAALLERLPVGATVIALGREGTSWTSRELAARLDAWRQAAGPTAFVIGGSHGLAPDFLARADARWSLGPLTLPHELARVVLLEQLYRAFTILRGEAYHKGGL